MRRLGDLFARVAQRYLPDPMVLACALTLGVLVAAWVFPQAPALRGAGAVRRADLVLRMWLEAVWNPAFLTFALQMCVVLLTGFGLARAPVAKRLLRSVARSARGGRGAVFLIAFTSCLGCWINWGFGLILAGVLATEIRREFASKGARLNYPLIVAAAYAGMMIWHGGLSGSAPLKVASDGVRIQAAGAGSPEGLQIPPISITTTVFNPANLVLTCLLVIGVPWFLSTLGRADASSPEGAECVPPPPDPSGQSEEASAAAVTPADWFNRTRVLPVVLASLVIAALTWQLVDEGHSAVGLNFVNSTFFALGLLLHRGIGSYMAALAEGGRAIVGIVIQFPLYGGIQGVMVGAGLAVWISQSFVWVSQASADALGIAVQHTFPVATLISAGFVNFLVPSGGGQWVVQGPIMCGAASAVDVPFHQTVMAISYGDQLTNMVQPFWAIPLMGMTRVDAHEFMGYTALLMLMATPVFVVALLLF